MTKTPLVLRPKLKPNAGLDKKNQDWALRALLIVLFWFFCFFFSNSWLVLNLHACPKRGIRLLLQTCSCFRSVSIGCLSVLYCTIYITNVIQNSSLQILLSSSQPKILHPTNTSLYNPAKVMFFQPIPAQTNPCPPPHYRCINQEQTHHTSAHKPYTLGSHVIRSPTVRRNAQATNFLMEHSH